MSTGITGDFDGLNRLIANFGEMASGGRFRSMLSSRLAEAARAEVGKSFDQERDPYGNAWQKLSPATIKARRGGGVGAKILQDTRRLRRSITSRGAYTSDANGFEIGTNVEYAAIHNFGGTIPPHSRKVVVNFNRKGRFTSAAKAVTSQRVHATWNNGIHIPKRQFIPEGTIGPIWAEAFKKETAATINALFEGRR